MSMPQHLSALQRANEIRLWRAELKRQIARGDVTVAGVLNGPTSSLLAGMPVAQLLAAQRHWGGTRAARLLSRLWIGQDRQVGELTGCQRRLIVDALDRDAGRTTAAQAFTSLYGRAA